jgi:hypothetical protein
MRLLALVAILALCTSPALAQDEAPEQPQSAKPLFFLDLGPGFFASLDDSSSDDTARSGITTFVGAGAYLGTKVALSARLNMTQQDEKSVLTSVWGWLTYTFGNPGPGPYIAVGAGTQFNGNVKFAGRGGYQIGLFGSDVLAFLEAEGRYVNEEEVTSLGMGNLGMRFNWGNQ